MAGTGNAVTDASYDASTKTITVTKGATFALADHGHDLPENDHTHVDGKGTKVTGDTAKAIDLNVEFKADLVEKSGKKYLQLVDATDKTIVIAEFDTTEFIKDGMIKSVELKTSGEGYAEADGPYLVFTWNLDDAIDTDADTAVDVLWVPVKDLVDVYTAGKGLTLTNREFAHQAKPTTGTAQVATAGTGRTYVTEVLVDDLGHIAGIKTATEADQDLSQCKMVQTAVADPTANGKALAFIDTISQNEQGVITATKKNVNFDDYALKSELPTATDFGVTKITSNDTTPGTDSNVSGLKITPADGTGTVNIEIDDTVTFIFDCGGAPV